MPTVRYTADGGHHRVGGHGFDPGDERDVDDELAAYLADHEDFEVLEELGAEDDVDEWADWNEEDWLELDYQQRAEDVQEGRVDEHLEAIADVETSDTVIGAVDERRDELEG